MKINLKLFLKNNIRAFGLYLTLTLMAIAVMGCGVSDSLATEDKETITVFAAASLTNSVGEIADQYRLSDDLVEVQLNFAGTKTLRAQLENGAGGDIFLSANEKHYKALLEQDLLHEGRHFVTNEMVLVLSKEGAKKIHSLEDLQESHRLILAEEGVPAGNYARAVIQKLGDLYGSDYQEKVLDNLVSSESNVRQVMTKIALGEGDAAILYKTDVTSDVKDQVGVIEIPKDYNVTANYWMALVKHGMISEKVQNCYDYFASPSSCEIFEKYGFSCVE
jgi:molybdate transport system substrate-binding protein